MGWATAYVAKLKAGETVSFRPRGGSMTGGIDDISAWLIPYRGRSGNVERSRGP